MHVRSSRTTSITLALALAITLLAPLSPAAAADELPKLFGLVSADDQDTIDALEAATGRGPAIWQIFHDLSTKTSFSSSFAARLADRGAVVYIEVTTQDLAGLNSGKQDGRVKVLVDGVKAHLSADASRRVLIAPLPEANLADHPWGGDPAGYRKAYRRIHDAFRDAGMGPSKVQFVFAMNGWSSSGLNYGQFFPGDEYVALLGFARKNRGNPWYDYEQSFGRFLREMETTVPSSAPILVAQTGSVEAGGKRDAWLRDMFRKLRAHPRVIGAIYFNRDHPDADYRVITGGSVDARVRSELPTWSKPSAVSFLFDGRLEAWTAKAADTSRMPKGAIPLSGDWNGDRRDGPGWFHEGTFTLYDHPTATPRIISYGRKGDVPITGDWNGDGKDTIGIIRNGRWHLRNRLSSGTADISFTYGRIDRGDVPIIGDWNGDGKDTIGIIRNGRWHLRNRLAGGTADISFTYGRITRGDVPLVGDWNGDGKDTIGIVRNGRWHLRNRLAGGTADRTFTYGRVTAGDTPVMGDWTRDRRSSPAIVRGSDWHVRNELRGGGADIVWRY